MYVLLTVIPSIREESVLWADVVIRPYEIYGRGM